MLTSFIDAHQHAQSKIHGFLHGEEDETAGENENDRTTSVQLPEEIKVKAESEKLVSTSTFS